MEQRAFNRIPSNMWAQFYSEDLLYNAHVINCSENSLYIRTANCLPCKDRVEVHISINDRFVNLPGKIKRLKKVDELHFNIGIELTTPPDIYVNFIRSQLSAFKSPDRDTGKELQ